MSSNKKITMLVILDGFGWREEKKYNAIYHAKKPNLDRWLQEYPHAFLKASGPAVGLPKNYIGNSEVGHLTIGAGRIIDSPVVKINKKIDDASFFSNPALINTLEKVKKNGGTLHIMGLLSDAGVHSDIKHMYAFANAAHNYGISTIVVHPFLDGRDTVPHKAKQFINKLKQELKITGARIGSIHGRSYAMDRDKAWSRIEASYRVLTEPQNIQFKDAEQAIDYYYSQGISDEYIPPTQLDKNAIIKNGDGIIFFNFRSDRARQLTASFVDPNFDAFKTKKIKLAGFVTPTSYDDTVPTNVMYAPERIKNTLTQTLAKQRKTIFAIAETEKYAHVTYFFNGGTEDPVSTETRTLITSKKEVQRHTSSCMEANKITHAVINSLKDNPLDFYLINYANADILGHTGNFDETVKAVECLDHLLGDLYEQVIKKMNGTIYITADHGNAEDMYDEVAKQPRTAHTTNPVPFLWINQKEKNLNKTLPLQQLSDIAPFILKNMGLTIPDEMQP